MLESGGGGGLALILLLKWIWRVHKLPRSGKQQLPPAQSLLASPLKSVILSLIKSLWAWSQIKSSVLSQISCLLREQGDKYKGGDKGPVCWVAGVGVPLFGGLTHGWARWNVSFQREMLHKHSCVFRWLNLSSGVSFYIWSSGHNCMRLANFGSAGFNKWFTV